MIDPTSVLDPISVLVIHTNAAAWPSINGLQIQFQMHRQLRKCFYSPERSHPEISGWSDCLLSNNVLYKVNHTN